MSVVQAQRQIHRAFGPAVQERSLRTIADHAGLAMDAAPGSGGPIRRPDPAARSGGPIRGAPVTHWQAGQSRAGSAMRAIAQIKPTFAGYRGGDDDFRLAGCGQSAISSTQPDLGFPRNVPNGRGQRFETVVKLAADPCIHAVCPGPFDQHAPG